MFLQGVARDQARTEFGQLSFGFCMKMPEEMFGNDELKNGVAEKFQALIIEPLVLRFVAQAGMSQRFGQKERIAKFVIDAFLERVHLSASDKSRAT